jgi:hypothetical protein
VEHWITPLTPCFGSVSGFIIREEYIEAARAVIEVYKNGPSPASADPEDGRNSTGPQQFDFRNPFLTSELPPEPSSQLTFIALGHPGIGKENSFIQQRFGNLVLGKTAWLHVLLIWRLHAGLPIIYQSRPSQVYYFGPEGAFLLKISDADQNAAAEFSKVLPRSTWCLVDSNAELQEMPMFIRHLPLFAIQAASPRWSRIKWGNKHKIMLYYMKPWSLTELIIGYLIVRRSCHCF